MVIVFKKIGDFHEVTGEIAYEVGKLLNLTVTRGRVSGEPMVGIPYHAITRAAEELRSKGHIVSI